jgi:VIT1/CCC1 family predicted Fe2+/Mn2+ transporter
MKIFSKKSLESYISEFVYGAIDGTVTTFAVVAAAAGAGLGVSVALVMGIANLFADGFSMGVSAYLGKKSGKAQTQKLKTEFRNKISSDTKLRDHLTEHMQDGYGLSGELLDNAVNSAMKNPQKVINHLEQDLFGAIESDDNPLHLGLATFVAFILLGSVPLLAYLFTVINGTTTGDTLFIITCILTLIAFAIIGYCKGYVTKTNRIKAVLETMFLGGSAAAISFIVGKSLESLI